MATNKNVRQRYKRYLRDPEINIPRATKWRRTRQDNGSEGIQLTSQFHSDSGSGSESDGDVSSNSNSDLAEKSEHFEGLEAGNDFNNEVLHEHPGCENHLTEAILDDHSIYEGSSVTRGQALGLAIAYALRNNIAGVALAGLLDLVNTLVPGSLPKTKYYIEKLLYSQADQVQYDFYCSNCQCLFGPAPQHESCPDCATLFRKEDALKEGSYILRMPLANQIKSLFEDHGISDIILKDRHSSREVIKDIYDGKCYQQAEVQAFLQNSDNISMTFNTDGVPVFSSSNFCIWPVLCTINELPRSKRRDHVLVHSLWFGKHKPRMDTLMQPFVDEMCSLKDEGVQWERNNELHTTKCIALVCACDSVARCAVQNVKQFNGEYGCSFCLHPGQVICKGRGYTRVYPADICMEQRSHAQNLRHAEEAVTSGDAVFGVKGPCILYQLPYFDVIKGFSPDYMHSALLGVSRQFVNVWLDTGNNGEPYYLGPEVARLDDKLSAIRPPSEVTRLPRSLLERKFWKANEWRAFLLLYSPVILQHVLPLRYFRHWMLFSVAISVFLSSEISRRDIHMAHVCLVKFVSEISALYGIEHVSYNCHLMVHLADSVKNWGPLWATSCFVFEDTAGRLLSYFHGTQHVSIQMFKRYLAKRTLVRFHESFVDAAEHVTETFQRMSDTIVKRSKCIKISEDCSAFTENLERLTATDALAIEATLGRPVLNRSCMTVHRFLKDSVLFTSSEYSAKFKRNNSFVLLACGNFGTIKKMVRIRLSCTCDLAHCDCDVTTFIIVEKMTKLPLGQMHDGDAQTDLLQFRKPIHESQEHVACLLNATLTKVCVCEAAGSKYAIPLPVFEFD